MTEVAPSGLRLARPTAVSVPGPARGSRFGRQRSLVVWRLLLLALVLPARTGAQEEGTAERGDDRLTAWVQAVRRQPEGYTYARLALRAAQELYPDLDGARQAAFEKELDQLAGKLKKSLPGARTGREKVELLSGLLFREVGLRRARDEVPEKENPDHYFPHRVLVKKEGVCLGLGLIYLAVAERTGLPVAPVHAPQHLYLRYDDGKEQWNLEPTEGGRVFDERAFMARYRMKPEEARTGPYFRPLSKLEVLGDLLNALAWFSAIGTAPRPLPRELALRAGRLCVELGPDDFNNWDTLAQALLYGQRPQEALAALRQALVRRPEVSGLQDQRYWQDRLARFTTAAEKGGAPPTPPEGVRRPKAGP